MAKFSTAQKVLISASIIAGFGFFILYKHHQNNTLSSKVQAMLNMDFWEFDQTEHGWRSLDTNEAVKIIGLYIRSNTQLLPNDKAILYFHAGQIYAEMGDYKTAIEQLELSKQSPKDWVEIAWNAYVDGTIAFLNNDTEALLKEKAILERYKDKKLENSKGEIFYPHRTNFNVIEQLHKGLSLGLTYAEAYRRQRKGVYHRILAGDKAN